MARFSPKIEIINHFDNLINRVDIDIDTCLEKYNEEKILGELLKSSENTRRNFRDVNDRCFNVDFYKIFNSTKQQYQSFDSCTESTKVIDYLKQVRMKTIEELRKAQEDTLEYYKLNSSRFISELSDEKNTEQLRSDLFADNYYFQINFKQSEMILWPFNVFTFVTDFYISPSDIDSLEKLINAEKEPFCREIVFDDKTVLIGLLYKYFIVNLLNFPSHLIRVRKEDVLNIEKIAFGHEYSGANLTSSSAIDLSKLDSLYLVNEKRVERESVTFNIEGLSSLRILILETNSKEINFSLRSLNSLILLVLRITSCTIDENILTNILDQVPKLEQLDLVGNFSYFKLDSLVNLKVLSLIGTINESFNIELFKNLCYQLEHIEFILTHNENIDENTLFKLFDRNFSSLKSCCMYRLNIKRLKKEFISRFPMLRRLFIINSEIEEIEKDAFSNLNHLTLLDLSRNRLKFIEKNAFSNLTNLEVLDLSTNELTNIDSEFIGVRNTVKVFQNTIKRDPYFRYWLKNYNAK